MLYGPIMIFASVRTRNAIGLHLFLGSRRSRFHHDTDVAGTNQKAFVGDAVGKLRKIPDERFTRLDFLAVWKRQWTESDALVFSFHSLLTRRTFVRTCGTCCDSDAPLLG